MTRKEEWQDPEIQRLAAELKLEISAYLHDKSRKKRKRINALPRRLSIQDERSGRCGEKSTKLLHPTTSQPSREGLIVTPLELEEPAA